MVYVLPAQSITGKTKGKYHMTPYFLMARAWSKNYTLGAHRLYIILVYTISCSLTGARAIIYSLAICRVWVIGVSVGTVKAALIVLLIHIYCINKGRANLGKSKLHTHNAKSKYLRQNKLLNFQFREILQRLMQNKEIILIYY